MAKPKPKYATRFDNFFLNLRLNRADFAAMAAHTLAALEAEPEKYAALITALKAALAAYRNTHAGQLSGQGQGATITLGQALIDFKEYVKRVERKAIIPNYDANSADVKALLPHGRSGLTKSSQTEVEDAFTAFLNEMDIRLTVFTAPLRTEGRKVLKNLQTALTSTDTADKDSGTRRVDLHDGRLATCVLLYQVYATLLLEYFENPKLAAPFFDLSKAGKAKSGPKPPKE